MSKSLPPFHNRLFRDQVDLVPDLASNHTLYRYHATIRTHLEIQSEGKHIRHVAAQAISQAAQVMEHPADLISAQPLKCW